MSVNESVNYLINSNTRYRTKSLSTSTDYVNGKPEKTLIDMLKENDEKNKEKPKDIKTKPSLFLFLAALSAYMGALCSWSAPAFRTMEEEGAHPHTTTDDDNETWIASIATIGALFGGMVGGAYAQRVGRKIAIISYGIPFTAGWLSITFGKSVTLMLIGRGLTGFCCGTITGTVPMYICEIAPKQIRGIMGAAFQLSITIGLLITYCIGAAVKFHPLAAFCMVPGILMSIMMIMMPETPIFLLLKHGRGPEVEHSLRKLRHTTSDIQGEIDILESEARESKQGGLTLAHFKKPEIYKPFLLGMALMMFQQFSGVNAILFYATNIFKSTGSSVDASLSTIIVGIAQVGGTTLGTILMDRLGRKLLLNISGLGHIVSLSLMGYFFYQKEQDPSFATSTGWLPITCLVVFNVFFSVGYGPIPWLMLPEMLPVYARGSIGSIATAFNWTCSFIVTKFFKSFSDAVKSYGTFWTFAAICVMGLVFSFLLLPETKGRTVEEIQREFTKNNRIVVEDKEKGDFKSREGKKVSISMPNV